MCAVYLRYKDKDLWGNKKSERCGDTTIKTVLGYGFFFLPHRRAGLQGN